MGRYIPCEFAILSSRSRTATIRLFAVYNFPPFYSNQLVLITVAQYQKEGGLRQGTLVGISEQQSLQEVLQGLATLSPSSNAYFVTRDGKLVATEFRAPWNWRSLTRHPRKIPN